MYCILIVYVVLFLYDRQHGKFVYIALQTYITLGHYAMMVVIGNKDC